MAVNHTSVLAYHLNFDKGCEELVKLLGRSSRAISTHFLVAAANSEEAKGIVQISASSEIHPALMRNSLYKAIIVRPANEEDMRNRNFYERSKFGGRFRINCWDRYQEMRYRREAGVICTYVQ